MYPQSDLTLLDLRKRALLSRIQRRREECALYLGEVMKPVGWADGVRQKWNAISPLTKLAAIPAGLFVARKLMPRMGGVLGWAPVAIRLFRSLR